MDIIDAISKNDMALLTRLLIEGDDPNVVDDSVEVSPLHYAASYGNYHAVLLLLTAGALIKEEKLYGKTPIFFVEEKNKRLADLLMRVSLEFSEIIQ